MHGQENDDKNNKVKMKLIHFSTTIDKGGLFSSASVEYVIETMPMKWTVVRKFEDALWLRDQIQRLYPGAIVLKNIITTSLAPTFEPKGRKI